MRISEKLVEKVKLVSSNFYSKGIVDVEFNEDFNEQSLNHCIVFYRDLVEELTCIQDNSVYMFALEQAQIDLAALEIIRETRKLKVHAIDPFEGTEGQDRESYTDTQDRENYT